MNFLMDFLMINKIFVYKRKNCLQAAFHINICFIHELCEDHEIGNIKISIKIDAQVTIFSFFENFWSIST